MAKLPLFHILALFTLVFFAGCSIQSRMDQQMQELQTVQSWAATAHMASDAWERNDVPTRYAQRTLQTAQQSIQDSLDTLTQAAPTQAAMLTQVGDIAQSIEQMEAAVERGDRTALQQQTAQLATQEQMVEALANQLGGQQ